RIAVRNGDRVRAGDLLLALDDTQTKANLGIVVSQLTELIGRRSRLEAERDNHPEIKFPAGFETQSEDAKRIASGERRLIADRRATTASQKKQLEERVGQYELEIEGLKSQRKAKGRELEIAREELQRLEEMYRKNLIPVTRVLSVQRDIIRIEGEHGQLTAQLGRVGGQISETRVQILTLEQTQRSDAQKELREIEGRIAELSERKVAAEDQLRRVEIRAPQSGVVHDMAVHTVGGVVGAGEMIMLIVPSEDRLMVEVKVQPQDIDQIKLGQPAMLRFTAFNQRTTPEVKGQVARVAADLSKDGQTGQQFFVLRIAADEQSLSALVGLQIVPGMPVEAFLEGRDRTVLSYLVRPITDQFKRALRER
ncbi:MAG TPA: HlyD family type I secretion periplasmic adaptor subunit, partial [Hyphomicrobiaceae bacterium]|nr:HlyD family type I secretion periplasmic adaptor subunit [Hyphomicrobiaceae bacterium]